VGSGAEPQPKSNFVRFSFKIRILVSTILMIFLRIHLANFVQAYRYMIVLGKEVTVV